MRPYILVQSGRVVKRDALELFQRCAEVVELGKTTSSLRLNLRLDGSQPSPLQLDALRNDFLS